MSAIPETESPIRVVVAPSQSSCFAGEAMSVTITFTNTRSIQSAPQRNQPYLHKRSAHSISAVPLARPPTSPRTPRTTISLLPTRSRSESDSIGRMGLIGRGKNGQTGDLKRVRVPIRSLSLEISPRDIGDLIPSPLEVKTPVHVQRTIGNYSLPTSPLVSSPLARSASLPLSSKHPHARKMSVLDAHFPSHEPPSPITPSTMTSSASTSSYSLSLDPISESSQSSAPATPFGASYSPSGAASDFPLHQKNTKAPILSRPPASRPGHLQIGRGPPPPSQCDLTHNATDVNTPFPPTNTEIILYSYVQFIGSFSITPINGTMDSEQERTLNSLRSTLLKRSIIGGGSMDITASLDPTQRKSRSLNRHARSSSFSSGLFSLLPSPSSLLGSGPKPSTSPSQSRVPPHRPTASMQASQSAPTLSTSESGPSVNAAFGLSLSSTVASGLIDPETPLPTYEVQPTMLAVDLSLSPGESCSYTYSLTLPQNLPPTFRGRTFKFSYELVVGVCRGGLEQSSGGGSTGSSSNSRVMKVPVRVYNNVTVGKHPSPYDLLWPVIYARSPTQMAKPKVTKGIQQPKTKFTLRPPVSTQSGSVDAIREYANRLLVSVPDLNSSGGFDVDAGRDRDAGGLTGCREAVEILSRNPKKMSYDINKDGVEVGVLTFTKSAYRLGETVLCVVDLNERKGRSRVMKLSAVLETHESLPTTIANYSSSRLLRRSHAEHHSSLVSSTLRTTFSLDIPPDASPAFQFDVNGEPGYLEQRPPLGVAGGLEWKVRLCLLVAVAPESTREGSDGVRLKSLVRDGPRGEWGSSWRGAPNIAPMQYPIQSNDLTPAGTQTGLRSWATYFASPFLGASQEMYEANDTDDYNGDDPIAEDDEGWVPVKAETVECEVPIKVWPGNTAFQAVDVVFGV